MKNLREMTRSLRRALARGGFQRPPNQGNCRAYGVKASRGRSLASRHHAANACHEHPLHRTGPTSSALPINSSLMVQPCLLVGLYGQGKTTTTAKLAEWYRRKHGLRVAVIEADVHRPGAYAQLSQLARRFNRASLRRARHKGRPHHRHETVSRRVQLPILVIVDTAGRHQLDQELVDELEQISGLTRANERWLVIDAQVGQAAGPVAASFHTLAGVSRALSSPNSTVRHAAVALFLLLLQPGHPIVHIGVGENIGDLEKFESDRFISRLLGMGDIQGLIDLAPEDMDEEEAMRSDSKA